MRILILGGTRYFGRSLTAEAVSRGHEVFITSCDPAEDCFGNSVKRINVSRADCDGIRAVFSGFEFDIIFDNSCFSPDEMNALLDVVRCRRYIFTSSTLVYDGGGLRLTESAFDPLGYHPDTPAPVVSGEVCACGFTVGNMRTYAENKRRCEAALFGTARGCDTVAVRLPVVLGPNDCINQLKFYVDSVMDGAPISVRGIDNRIELMFEVEAGRYLASLIDSSLTGTVHVSSDGIISLRELIHFIEDRSGCSAVLTDSGTEGVLNYLPTCTLDKEKARSDGFLFLPVNMWMPRLVDYYIEKHRN